MLIIIHIVDTVPLDRTKRHNFLRSGLPLGGVCSQDQVIDASSLMIKIFRISLPFLN